MPDKKPPKTFLTVKFSNGVVANYSIQDLLSCLPVSASGIPNEIRIGMERDGIEMHASIQPKEAEYPGITVDASTAQAGEVWLGNFELPNESYPTRIQARLYAGCGKYETDEPIAIATHEITDDARVIYRSSKHGDDKDRMHKIVYVDEKSARTMPWTTGSEDEMPEHLEDEL